MLDVALSLFGAMFTHACSKHYNFSSQGKDDLRQDAVMQQVFVLVNRLLKKEPTTSKRRLCVLTYIQGSLSILYRRCRYMYSSVCIVIWY